MEGTFIISLDFEMLWGLAGWNQTQIKAYKARVEGARVALSRILEVLSQEDMKCTIAFVGGMNYASLKDFNCAIPGRLSHYMKPLFSSYDSLLKWVGKDFSEELLFCKDVLSELSGYRNVELGSHTFSHYYCLEEGQSVDDFEADIKAACIEARKNHLDLKTIIFPRNQVSDDYLAICAKYGFSHYRGNRETFLYRSGRTPKAFSLQRILRLLDTYFNLSGYGTYASPTTRKGMVNVPSSRFFRPYFPALSILEPLKVQRIKKSLRYAAMHGQIYHLWWHPHNFGLHTDKNIAQLQSICQYYHFLHEHYGMENKFIREINPLKGEILNEKDRKDSRQQGMDELGL